MRAFSIHRQNLTLDTLSSEVQIRMNFNDSPGECMKKFKVDFTIVLDVKQGTYNESQETVKV